MNPLSENGKSIFLQALELPEGQSRQEFLDSVCHGNDGLRREVDELLAHHGQTSGFLETPPTAVVVATRHSAAADSVMPRFDFLTPSADGSSLGRLAHYEIQEVIGSGGFGVVFKARDTKLDRIVAIKTLAQSLASSAVARQRFVREAKAAAAVNHENVVSIHAVADDGPVPYLVMEYVSGVSLEEKIDQMGALDLRAILRIGMQIACGLAAAHKQGLVHRDVKPGNILLENGVERVRITDFGLARAAHDAAITQTGEVAGTPQYMSPEQVAGHGIDSRSDLFSLGSVLYAMCTGRSPFRAETTLAALRRVCDDEQRPIREINSEIPQWLVEVVDRLLAKKPDKRFQTAAEVADLLGDHLAQLQHPAVGLQAGRLTPDVRQDSKLSLAATARWKPAARGRRWALAAVAAALLLLVVLGLTDATGVTQVLPTVMRIVTGEGTLVVELTDPEAQVTLEGDGGLVIHDRGGTFRVPAGIYKVRAEKEGQRVPLDKELVTISRGREEVVRVRLESASAPAAVKPVDVGEFVLPGGKGIAERHFDTLGEAINGASAGDTIEIRGNGPFVAAPLVIERPLTMRAAIGFHPVFEMTIAETPDAAPMLISRQALTLEGLEFRLNAPSVPPGKTGVLRSYQDLSLANCRFALHGQSMAVHSYSSSCTVRNCQFVAARGSGAPWCLTWTPIVDGQLHVDCCLFALDAGAALSITAPTEMACAQVTRNTFVGGTPLSVFVMSMKEQEPQTSAGGPLRVTFDASGNVFGSTTVLSSSRSGRYDMSSQEAGDWLRQCVKWREDTNVYASLQRSLTYFIKNARGYSHVPIDHVGSLAEWENYWGLTGTSAAVGPVRFATGDTLARAQADPRSLAPEDFRLRAGSPGYRAGLDGQDLGASIDLVGPGWAYERWKRTSAYAQWLKDTGQVE